LLVQTIGRGHDRTTNLDNYSPGSIQDLML
jgi:hypothetical protein